MKVSDAVNEYLGDQDEDFFFCRDKQTGTVMEKVHQDEGRLY